MESADIKNAGLKVTLPRMKILQLLEDSPDRHLKAEDVYKTLVDSGEEIALATVYRVLTQFEAAGLVTRCEAVGLPRGLVQLGAAAPVRAGARLRCQEKRGKLCTKRRQRQILRAITTEFGLHRRCVG